MRLIDILINLWKQQKQNLLVLLLGQVLLLGLALGLVRGPAQMVTLLLWLVMTLLLWLVQVRVQAEALGQALAEALVRQISRQISKGSRRWLVKALPEEWWGELEALHHRWHKEKRSLRWIKFMTAIHVLDLLKAYVVIKVQDAMFF